MHIRSFLVGGLLLYGIGLSAQSLQVSVQNPIRLNRRDLAQFPLQEICQRLGVGTDTPLRMENADGEEVPCQKTHDGWLLVQSSARPEEEETFRVSVGLPHPFPCQVSGRVYPDRMDDLGWENDRNAWRVYGPALRKDNPHGIDCFTKTQPLPSLDSLYQDMLHRGISYHENHGLGMDAYSVGPTLGCGAPALMQGDSLLYAVVYDKVEILDNGPLRFTARLTYRHSDGRVETRLLQQDKGTHLVRCAVSYTGVQGKADVISGIVVHKDNPEAYLINRREQYVAYADNLGSPKTRNGQLFVACLYPTRVKRLQYLPLTQETAGGIGHVIGRQHYHQGDTFVYYFGSGWSGYDVPTMHVWQTLLCDYRQCLLHPLQTAIGERE